MQRRIGSPSGPPKIVALIDLSDTSDSAALLKMCLDAADWHAQSQASPSQFNAQYLSLKTRCTYIMPSNRADLANLLEISKVADVVMLVISISDDECADIVNSVRLQPFLLLASPLLEKLITIASRLHPSTSHACELQVFLK